MEFESDDDMAEQSKNPNDVKTSEKVRVTKKAVLYYEFSREEEKGEHADPKKSIKPKMATSIQAKRMKMIRLLCPMK